jgi:hypothetical protein
VVGILKDLLLSRAAGLRAKPEGGLSPGRHLCRADSQGREARRPAGDAVHQIRLRDQPQDREGTRPRHADDHPDDRQRGD